MENMKKPTQETDYLKSFITLKDFQWIPISDTPNDILKEVQELCTVLNLVNG